MSKKQPSFKALLAELQGLRIVAEDLFISENHRLLVVSRITKASTPWAVGVPEEILRTLALGLTQAAWAHFLDPRRNSNGVPQPHCKLAIAALRFANDVSTYESHLKQPEDITDLNFLEFRGKVYREDGRPICGPNGKQVTQPVFPIYGYRWAADPLPADQLSVDYNLTREEPKIFEQLQRV
ncbi:hypothetical protein NEMBOFW57_001171 [Staphylotrichum longicolle]|uniref:Uncharacterized protein n=1 Tax=Staphylotrichum longicolle TaxID=669026 RepID=A0AAD4F1K3_9PEZI|nr:hypothetical protein NEMBOFW57_001171 [Staphylotrichum longicolle]